MSACDRILLVTADPAAGPEPIREGVRSVESDYVSQTA
jgi:hypothetical protein